MVKFIYKHLLLIRRVSQIFVLFAMVLIPFLNKMGIHRIYGTLYSMNIGELNIADPAMILQTTLLLSDVYIPLIMAGIIPIILAFTLGKVFCSWICPYNLIAEFAVKLRWNLLKNKKPSRNHNPEKYIYWVVYGILLMVMLLVGAPLFTFLSMPGIISSQLTGAVFSGSIGIEIFLVFTILFLEFFVSPRFWCKYGCPVGATLAFVHPQPIMQVSFNSQKCICRTEFLPCQLACPLNLDPRRDGIYPYCFNCGSCMDACRNEGQALNFILKSKEYYVAKEK